MRPNWLFQPVDISWLVCFRIGFGVLMAWQAVCYVTRGWVRKNWIGHEFHFKFPLFEWVHPLPGDGMIVLFWVLAALAALVAAGCLYRLSAALLWLGHTYVFLIEQACYQNHSYLICLLAFLCIFLPAHHSLSVDALLRKKLRSRDAPAWTLWLVRFQVGVPYFFGGIAKLNPDWLGGEPLRRWLPARADFPVFGPHFARREDWAIYLFSYSGLVIDLLAVPLLLWRRTRLVTFAALCLFHVSNARLFAIGVFPWMMIVLTTVFFAPDLPRRIARDLRPPPRLRGWTALAGAAGGVAIALWFLGRVELPPVLAGVVGGVVLGWFAAPWVAPRGESVASASPATSPRPLVAAALAFWVSAQCLVPLRHFAIPGRVAWTVEGERFSWHMKLNDRDGEVIYHVTDPVGDFRARVDPRAILVWWQVNRLDGRPHMIRQLARHLAAKYERAKGIRMEVRAHAVVSLNGRPAGMLIDPDVDLARAESPLFGHAPWILPLEAPAAAPR